MQDILTISVLERNNLKNIRFISKDLIVKLALITLLIVGCQQQEDSESDSLSTIPMSGLDPIVTAHIEEQLERVRNNPDSGATTGRLAMILHSYKITESAEHFYAKASELQTDEFQWPYLHAVTLQELSRNEQALAKFQALEQRRPDYLPIQLRVAMLLGENNQLDQSIEQFQKLLASHSDKPVVQFSYGQVLMRKGDTSLAIDTFKRAIYLQPNYRAAHYALASAYRADGQAHKAAEHAQKFEQLEDQAAVISDPYVISVKSLARTETNAFNSAVTAIKRGDRLTAITQFNRVLEFNASNYSAHINLIGLYGDSALFDKSEEHFELAKALRPDHPKLYNNIGAMRLRNQQFELARQAFEKATQLDPDYAIAWRNLGKANDELNDAEASAKQFQRSLELNPNDRQSLLFYALLLLRQNQSEEAIPMLEKTAVGADATAAQYYRVLAHAYSASNRSADAVIALNQAQKLARRWGQDDVQAKILIDLETIESGNKLILE